MNMSKNSDPDIGLRKLQGDSLARGPKLLSIKTYVNQLTDDELTTGYYQ